MRHKFHGSRLRSSFFDRTVPWVFLFPTSLSRAIRVLLTCFALVAAMPSATADVRGAADVRRDVSAAVAAVTSVPERASLVRARVAKARPHTDATGDGEREPARPLILRSEIRVQTGRAFFLRNCSWLC